MSYLDWHKSHPFQFPVFSKAEDIQWITVRGAHIPIKDGQSKEAAIKEHLGDHKPGSKKPEKGNPPDEKTLPKHLHEAFKNHPRDKSLKGEHADIQEASIHKYHLQREHLRDEYIKEHGKVANADDARKHFADVGFYNGNAICMFQQDEGTVEILRQHYLVYIPVKKDAGATYRALEKAISKEVGQRCELVFTNGQPTVWKTI